MLNNMFKKHAQHEIRLFSDKLIYRVNFIQIWILNPIRRAYFWDGETVKLGNRQAPTRIMKHFWIWGYLLLMEEIPNQPPGMYKIPINNAINYHINWLHSRIFFHQHPRNLMAGTWNCPPNGKGETSTQTTNFWVPSTVGKGFIYPLACPLSGDTNENPVTFTSHHCIGGATRALEALWQLGTGWGGGGDLKQLKTLPGSQRATF